ncbi:GntR family transcriptional regulator [Paraburkholderia flagellata]|uniref:GntR family transcriptional regulator n=1 Tax=Paraburkholderia flagellata TaxID=2883241 RepID=UPI001F3E4A5E|nr:GntR family transcriptional regulator [Paraburkholderia flagellata]
MVEMPLGSPVALAVNFLLEKIRQGEFAGGHRLVEGDLAAELDVSRGSIREALRILAGDGVVELIPHKGASVKRLNEGELIQIYEALTGMHWAAVRICAKRSDEQEIQECIGASLKRLSQVRMAEDHLSWFLALGEYHRETYRLSGNPILKREQDRMHNVHFHRELTRYIKVGNWDKYLSVYQRLTDAIRTGDVKKSGNIIADHLDHIVELLRQTEKPAIFR